MATSGSMEVLSMVRFSATESPLVPHDCLGSEPLPTSDALP